MTKTFQTGQRVKFTEAHAKLMTKLQPRPKNTPRTNVDWSTVHGTVARVEAEGWLVTVDWDGHGQQGLNPQIIRPL